MNLFDGGYPMPDDRIDPDLLAERDALRAALEFYADPASWKRSSKQGGWPVAESQAVLKDRGKRARAALDTASGHERSE